MYHLRTCLFLTAVVAVGLMSEPARAVSNEEVEKATKEAIRKVAPSVVQIVTQGGTDILRVGKRGSVFRKALGPTTGVIVSKDGYIISSAFNFINNPTRIFVEVPGRKEKYPAKKVATDTSRMLTLLKVEAKDLPVPAFVPKKDILVGHWALALGRTLDNNQDNPPSLSMGIISARNRIWGKCLQTDANTSPVNYGGPIVDIKGRVQGIVIPASPRGAGGTAGFEWYDSGIGFAVPMEDVMSVLPRLKKGEDLKRGLLGVRMRSSDLYGAAPVIGTIAPKTAAARAGLKAGDVIVEIDGKKIVRMAQMLHVLGTKYEGDSISLKYRRGNAVKLIKQLTLVGKMTSTPTAYLGILPMRDDSAEGVEIRHVFKDSPAAKAGLKAGDRIVKYGKGKNWRSFQGKLFGSAEFKSFLGGIEAGEKIQLKVKRKAGTKDISVALGIFPGTDKGSKDAPPAMLPEIATRKKALADPEPNKKPKKKGPPAKKPKIETGLVKQTVASGNQTYWIYVHEDYDPNVSHALLVWLHPPGKNKEKDLEDFGFTWDTVCARHNILIVAPKTASTTGWRPSDGTKVQEVIRDVMTRYTVDKSRVIAHGMSSGGQMALHLGFTARDLVRGVATIGAVPLSSSIKDNIPNRPLQLFIAVGDRDPLAKAVRKSPSELQKHNLPVIYREIRGLGRLYFDEDTMDEVVRWIDMLDRM